MANRLEALWLFMNSPAASILYELATLYTGYPVFPAFTASLKAEHAKFTGAPRLPRQQRFVPDRNNLTVLGDRIFFPPHRRMDLPIAPCHDDWKLFYRPATSSQHAPAKRTCLRREKNYYILRRLKLFRVTVEAILYMASVLNVNYAGASQAKTWIHRVLLMVQHNVGAHIVEPRVLTVFRAP